MAYYNIIRLIMDDDVEELKTKKTMIVKLTTRFRQLLYEVAYIYNSKNAADYLLRLEYHGTVNNIPDDKINLFEAAIAYAYTSGDTEIIDLMSKYSPKSYINKTTNFKISTIKSLSEYEKIIPTEEPIMDDINIENCYLNEPLYWC